MPWKYGDRPVNIAARAGVHVGVDEYACMLSAPFFANLFKFGVIFESRASNLIWSAIKNIILFVPIANVICNNNIIWYKKQQMMVVVVVVVATMLFDIIRWRVW